MRLGEQQKSVRGEENEEENVILQVFGCDGEEEERRYVEVAQHLQTKTFLLGFSPMNCSVLQQRLGNRWQTKSRKWWCKEDNIQITFPLPDVFKQSNRYFFSDLGNWRHIWSKFSPPSCSLQAFCKAKMTKQYCRRTRLFEGDLKEHFQARLFLLSSFWELWLC